MLRTACSTRPTAALLVAWMLGRLSIWTSVLAAALLAHQVGGATAVSLAMVARMVPAGVAAPALALLADRWPRRRVLWATLAGRAALLLAAAVLTGGGAGLGVLLPLVAGEAMLATAHRPAHVALLPAVAPSPAVLGAANIATSTADYAGFLIGSVAGGLVAERAGVPWALAVAAAAVALAALTSLLLPTDAAADDAAQPAASQARRVPPADEADADDATNGEDDSALAGLRTVWRDRELRLLSGVHLLGMGVQSATSVLLVIAAIELLGTGESGAGLLGGAWGVGGLAGGLLGTVALQRGRLSIGLIAGLALAGLPLAVVGLLPVPPLALLLLSVLGVGYALVEVAVLTMTQRLAAQDVLARVFGVQELLNVSGTALGAALVPPLVALTGASGALVITGLAMPTAALLGARSLRRLGSDVLPPEGPYALLRGLAMFAPLPLATVETLAVRAEMMHVPAGTTLIKEGEAGNALYVVESGRLAVHERARGERAPMLPGDALGEIALLRDVPRTASVTALEPSTLLVLDRASFLAAIGTHARSHRIADDLATGRLS